MQKAKKKDCYTSVLFLFKKFPNCNYVYQISSNPSYLEGI